MISDTNKIKVDNIEHSIFDIICYIKDIDDIIIDRYDSNKITAWFIGYDSAYAVNFNIIKNSSGVDIENDFKYSHGCKYQKIAADSNTLRKCILSMIRNVYSVKKHGGKFDADEFFRFMSNKNIDKCINKGYTINARNIIEIKEICKKCDWQYTEAIKSNEKVVNRLRTELKLIISKIISGSNEIKEVEFNGYVKLVKYVMSMMRF